MYRDRTLLPKEAMRMAVLGILAGTPMDYAGLATELRHFTSRIVGPSLELTGSSIEMLRLEGLIAFVGGQRLTLTEQGRAELRELLSSGVRAPFDGINRLVLALKMRFLHLLDAQSQRDQAEMMIEAAETELARIEDLRKQHAADAGHLPDFLAHDADEARARVEWFKELRAKL
jgi:DNA-binding PadR family transcriptional regulator